MDTRHAVVIKILKLLHDKISRKSCELRGENGIKIKFRILDYCLFGSLSEAKFCHYTLWINDIWYNGM